MGDVIRAINGIQTNQLKHVEVANIMLNAGYVISLQLEYDSSQGRTFSSIVSIFLYDIQRVYNVEQCH